MPNRFDGLLQSHKAARSLWNAGRQLASDVRDWLREKVISSDRLHQITQQLEIAENSIRDALAALAEKIFLKEGKPIVTPVVEHTGYIPPCAKPGMTPYFRLFTQPLDRESETDCPDSDYRSPVYSASDSDEQTKLARRLEALEGVLENPGRHACRYKRRLHLQELAAKGEPKPEGRLIAKDLDDVIFEHIDRMIDEPEYWCSEEGRKWQALFINPG